MRHPLINRTSPKGGPWVGKCASCGKENAKLADDDCTNPRGMSQEDALLEAISAPAAPEVPPRDHGLSVAIAGDRLTISIGIAALGFAATRGRYFDRLYHEGRDTEPVITDAAVFAEAILRELRAEEEDGTTLVHMMLDKAAENAVEQGAEGIRLPGDAAAPEVPDGR